MRKKINAAIAYDFDGTLTPDYMQHASFLPEVGISEPFDQFWPKVKKMAKDEDMDEILAYMHLMLHEANYKRISIKKEAFIKHGQKIQFFKGVKNWFSRINKYAAEKNINLKHYIISSGLREMIEGSSIGSEFEYIFASGFVYNQDDIAIWPALAVNYTNKTQYLFRINKGIKNSWENEKINKYFLPEQRPVPFKNIIYIGDGETDIPAMKMTKYNGGTSIAVYNPSKKGAQERSDILITQDRTDFSVETDFRAGTELDKIIKRKLDDIVSRSH